MTVETQMVASRASAVMETPLVGVWVLDEGYQVTEFLFRADGRYQLDTTSTNPDLDYHLNDWGRYQAEGQRLTLTLYEYFGEQQSRQDHFRLDGELLSLIALRYEQVQVYALKGGSRQDVLDREAVDSTLVGTGGARFRTRARGIHVPSRRLLLSEEFSRRSTVPAGIYPRPIYAGWPPADAQAIQRCRGQFEVDVFGSELTLIRREEYLGSVAHVRGRPRLRGGGAHESG